MSIQSTEIGLHADVAFITQIVHKTVMHDSLHELQLP